MLLDPEVSGSTPASDPFQEHCVIFGHKDQKQHWYLTSKKDLQVLPHVLYLLSGHRYCYTKRTPAMLCRWTTFIPHSYIASFFPSTSHYCLSRGNTELEILADLHSWYFGREGKNIQWSCRGRLGSIEISGVELGLDMLLPTLSSMTLMKIIIGSLKDKSVQGLLGHRFKTDSEGIVKTWNHWIFLAAS